ncbi:MAG TPA: hypothetical protein VFV50_09415 [Bdellovibrionales bacterium]|nr:hypothetical protein [Bdellovibrionales bacterium]
MTRVLTLFAIVFVTASALGQGLPQEPANQPRLTLEAEGWATKIHIYCAGAGCERVRITRTWGRDAYGDLGTHKLEDVSAYLQSQSHKKVWAITGLGELAYDPAAGGLNLFLPVIWLVAGSAALVMDGVELLTPQNMTMRRAIARFVEIVRSSEGSQTIRIGYKTYKRLDAQFTKIWRGGMGCRGATAY